MTPTLSSFSSDEAVPVFLFILFLTRSYCLIGIFLPLSKNRGISSNVNKTVGDARWSRIAASLRKLHQILTYKHIQKIIPLYCILADLLITSARDTCAFSHRDKYLTTKYAKRREITPQEMPGLLTGKMPVPQKCENGREARKRLLKRS